MCQMNIYDFRALGNTDKNLLLGCVQLCSVTTKSRLWLISTPTVDGENTNRVLLLPSLKPKLCNTNKESFHIGKLVCNAITNAFLSLIRLRDHYVAALTVDRDEQTTIL